MVEKIQRGVLLRLRDRIGVAARDSGNSSPELQSKLSGAFLESVDLSGGPVFQFLPVPGSEGAEHASSGDKQEVGFGGMDAVDAEARRTQ